MAITLSMYTALSGLTTSQQALNAVSQNIVNVNTEGYTRKTMSAESRVLDGVGAGVQTTALQRTVDEYLLRDVRKENSTLNELDTLADMYTRIEYAFGKVNSGNTLSNEVQALNDALTDLAANPSASDAQWAVTQAATSLSERLQSTTSQLNDLRTEIDGKVADLMDRINSLLSNISDLNSKIVRNGAVGLDVTDLQDKRDNALTELSSYMDITYHQRGDGSVTVYTGAGDALVDSQAATLTHTAVGSCESWMSLAGGQFSKITIDGQTDISGSFKSGQLKALIDLRDTIIPNLQSETDELARAVTSEVNRVHNQGTSLPDVAAEYTGTRVFADQDNITQAISLTGTEDTALVLYDTSGTQLASTTLRNLMNGNAFSPPQAALVQPWSIDNIASRMESWLQTQNYSNASLANVGLDEDGHFALSTGNTGIGLAFRDQVDSAAGSKATDITITFDVDTATGGSADETVKGFANFLGLNDFFVTNQERFIVDSEVMSAKTKLAVGRDLTLYDATGKIGNTVRVSAGATLSDIAAAINKQTKVVESAAQLGPLSISGAAGNTIEVIGVSNSVTKATYTIPAGPTALTLNAIAAGLNGQNGIIAKVVDDGDGQRLQVWDANGNPMRMAFSGPDQTAIEDGLSMQTTSHVNAQVVPDGAGVRLRIVQADGREVFMTSTTDGSGSNMLTELGLTHSATGISSEIGVRADVAASPSRVSRGAIQWNADTQAYYISEGDNTVANALAKVFTSKVSMRTAGDLYSAKYTLSEYATASISVTAQQASSIETRQSYQKTLSEELKTRQQSESGVNMDEEVANMIQYQQAYSASAKVITTLTAMMDTLLDTIR